MLNLQTLAAFLGTESSSIPEGPKASEVYGARSAEEHDAASGQRARGREYPEASEVHAARSAEEHDTASGQRARGREYPDASEVHGARSAEEHDAASGQRARGREYKNCGIELSDLAQLWARSPRKPQQPLQPIHGRPCNATTLCQFANYYTNELYHARCLAHGYLLRAYQRYGDRELVRDVSNCFDSDAHALSLVAFLSRIGMKQPKKFAQDLEYYQCRDIDTLFAKGPHIWNMKMRVHSGVAKQLENGVRHYRDGTFFWHYHMPRCDPLQAFLPEDGNLLASESDEGWWFFGMFGESEPAASANLPCNASVTLHDRQTRRADCLQDGARIASYNLRTGRASVSTVRSIARSRYISATTATLIVHLRSRTMDCYQLRVAPTQLLWCVDGSEGMWAAAGSHEVQLPGGQFAKQVDLGNVLVRRGGEACVVVRIEHDSDELVRLDMAGPRTLFIDGFLARSSGH